MEKTSNGNWLLVAEGGSLAFLDPTSRATFATGIENVKRVPIGFHGVVPVELRLDPDATLDDAFLHDEDRVYVAGGRDGFWVMHAHPDPAIELHAARVDHSSDAGPLGESGRWCSAVDIMDLGGTRYLVVLYSARSENLLRLYPLSAVRALLPAHGLPALSELGRELIPTAEIVVERPATAWKPTAGIHGFAEPFGLGMHVLGTHVYVALGTHGLVRLEFDAQNIGQPDVVAGPVFGNGSAHAQIDRLFEDLAFRDEGCPGTGNVQRSHPPIFVDVVAYSHGNATYVVTTVDHLGWMRFDVTNGFSETLPIEHHEGKRIVLVPATDPSCEQLGMSLGARDGEVDECCPPDPQCEPPPPDRTYARRLELLPTPSGPVLGVAAWLYPIWMFPGIHNEGRQVSSNMDDFGGVRIDTGKQRFEGTGPLTLLYRLHPTTYSWNSDCWNAFASIPVGGGHVKLVRNPAVFGGEEPVGGFSGQSFGGGGSQLDLDFLLVFTHRVEDAIGGAHSPGIGWIMGEGPEPVSHRLDQPLSTTRIRVQWAPVASEGSFDPDPHDGDIWLRTMAGRPGLNIRDAGPSLGAPELLHTGGNDMGLPNEGLLVVCDDRVEAYPWTQPPDPPPPAPPLNTVGRGAHGIIFESRAQWMPDPLLNLGGHILLGFSSWYTATVVKNGDPCGQPSVPPDIEKRVRIRPPRNRFGQLPRQHVGGAGAVNLDYDAGNVAEEPILFLSAVSTPDGIFALWRDELDAWVALVGDEDTLLLENQPHLNDIVIGYLDTHPEYQNVPTSETTFLADIGVKDLLQTYFPEVVPLALTNPSIRDAWGLIVPAGSVQIPSNHPLFVANPGWLPPPDPPTDFPSNDDRMKVRVFDVTDPGLIKDGSAPSWTLIGPHPRSHAARLRTAYFRGRTWCFVADLGGSVVVWDLTGILSHPRSILVGEEHEVWLAPGSLSDNLPSNLVDALPDVVGDTLTLYVGVWRYGLVMLDFQPDAAAGSRLVHVKTVHTPGMTSGLSFREIGGERQLIVSDTIGGLRIFRQAEEQ